MINVDWNEMWKQALEKSSIRWWEDSVGFWNKRADGFKKMNYQEFRRNRIIEALGIENESRILDIGAGTGVLSIPFANYSKSVTAIEPADEMMNNLQKRIKLEKINNINCIKKKWEEIDIDNDIANYDYVIASYCLSMYDMKSALEKMNKVAKKGVCLFTFVDGIAGDSYHKEIWEELYRKKFYSSPDYIYIVNILYQMGVRPNVEIKTNLLKRQYNSIDEAVVQWQNMLSIVADNELAQLKKYLEENLYKEGNEYFIIQETKKAMIWWEK